MGKVPEKVPEIAKILNVLQNSIEKNKIWFYYLGVKDMSNET